MWSSEESARRPSVAFPQLSAVTLWLHARPRNGPSERLKRQPGHQTLGSSYNQPLSALSDWLRTLESLKPDGGDSGTFLARAISVAQERTWIPAPSATSGRHSGLMLQPVAIHASMSPMMPLFTRSIPQGSSATPSIVCDDRSILLPYTTTSQSASSCRRTMPQLQVEQAGPWIACIWRVREIQISAWCVKAELGRDLLSSALRLRRMRANAPTGG